MKHSLLLASLLSSAPLALAQEVSVPGDYSDLQAALDAVPPGATIHVTGGNWFELRVEKPVTLHGHPTAFGVDPLVWGEGTGSNNNAPITLAGPGAGTVELIGFDVGAEAYSLAFETTDPAIQGGGFDELRIVDCNVSAPQWSFVYNVVRPGANGIDVQVPLVWIENSTVAGGHTVADPSDVHLDGFHAGHGVVASGTVVAIDAGVFGGNGSHAVHLQPACGGACPDGDGGHGVVSSALYELRSGVAGGFPSSWQDQSGSWCCSGSSGSAAIVGVRETLALAAATTRTGPGNVDTYTGGSPRLGAPWLGAVDVGSTGHTLAQMRFQSTPVSLPLPRGGTLLVAGALLAKSPLLSGPVAAYAVEIPADPALAGRTVTSQAVQLGGGLPFVLTNALDLTIGG